jgi:hypothetical protein
LALNSCLLKELNDYMREVSTPVHQYGRVAKTYLQTRSARPINYHIIDLAHQLAASTRAYTRVVLRLRAQAEAESENRTHLTSDPTRIRPPSPSLSSHSHSQNGHSDRTGPRAAPSSNTAFHSPLFRLRRAPLLHVFVPSPDGDWLSDASVLDCEAELKRAGVLKLLRMGDVVWDLAVGDDGNAGRLIWDGAYLIVSFRILLFLSA